MTTPSAPRTLGLIELLTLGIGSIMGTGVFVLTGAVAAQIGPAVMVSFALAAVCAALSAMCYAEMAGMLPPTSGSAYLYAKETLGETTGFVLGWILLLIYAVGAATLAVGLSGYAVSLLTDTFGVGLPESLCRAPLAMEPGRGRLVATGAWLNVPASVALLAVALVLNRGLMLSARLNNVLVLIKVLVVLVFLSMAVPHVDPALWRPFWPKNRGTFGDGGISGVFSGAMVLFFSYMGFDAVSAAAAEAQHPRRHIPLAILVSLGICATLYMATAACLTGIVPAAALHVPHPLAVGAKAIGAPWLVGFIDVGAIIGLATVLLAQLFVQPRILVAMAADGLLPASLAWRSEDGLPRRQTLVTAAICALFAGFLPIGALGEFTSLGILLMFGLVALGVMRERLRRPERPRSFRVPFGPFIIPGSAAVLSLGLVLCASWTAQLQMVVWMALGLGIYRLQRARRNMAQRGMTSSSGCR